MAGTILLVEDQEDNIIVILQILELVLNQSAVVVARDGREALSMAYEQRPALILMDLSLPKVDGWEVARSLRNDASFADVPILAVTAHAMVGDRERALAAGFNDYFAKPIDVDRFVEFVQPYLA